MSDALPIVLYLACVPPSANRMWLMAKTRNGTRQLSNEYAAWRDTTGWEVRRQMVGIEEIRCKFDVAIEVPNSRGDLDNLIKPTLDLLQMMHVISNDANASGVSISRRPGRDGCMVVLTPRPDIAGNIRSPANLTYRRAKLRPKQRKGGITSRMLLGMGR